MGPHIYIPYIPLSTIRSPPSLFAVSSPLFILKSHYTALFPKCKYVLSTGFCGFTADTPRLVHPPHTTSPSPTLFAPLRGGG